MRGANIPKMLQNIKMKKYLTNVFLAILGRNPYRIELDKVENEYELTAKKVAQLEEMRYRFEEKMCGTYQELAKAKEEIRGYQRLTENLRQSVKDKDAALDAEHRDRAKTTRRLMEEHASALKELTQKHERETIDRHEEYEARMAERDEKIAGLREDLDRTLELLQKANATIGKDLMAQSLLDKTNNGLEDLLTAMQSSDVERILMATQYLDWNCYLVRIAQVHLGVLRRKNELVERLHFTDASRDDDDNVNHE